MARKPLFETLKLLQGGQFLETAGDMLAEAVRMVDETGKAGKLTITLDLKKQNGAIAVGAKVTNKVPELPSDADLLWPTAEGNLSQQNPNQRSLDLQVVEAKQRDVQRVDTPLDALQRTN